MPPQSQPDVIHGPPRPRAYVRFRTRVCIAMWLSVALTVVAGVIIVWALAFNFFWPKLPRLGRQADQHENDVSKATWSFRSWLLWMESAGEVIGIILRALLVVLGGKRLISKGLRCLINFFPKESFPQDIFNNERLMNFLVLICFAILPTAISATFTTIVAGGFCNPDFNVFRFWPPRTRDDIKSILEGWAGLAAVHLKTGASLSQIVKWNLTIGRWLMWTLGVGVWTTTEIYIGPCRYYPLVWRFWFSILGVSLVSWFLKHADALIVKNWKSTGKAHVELLVFLGTFYVVRWVDQDGYCTKPSCW